MTRIVPFAILAVSALVLSGCGSDNPKGYICPVGTALVDAGSLTALPPGVTDPARATYKADLMRIVTDCDYDKDNNTIGMRVRIDFTVTRPPGGGAATYAVPYFLATTQDGSTIVDKKLFTVQAQFEAGQASINVSDQNTYVITPLPEKKSTDYAILGGLQLTKEQLDYNRTVGRFPK
jgi:hypothetical protein